MRHLISLPGPTALILFLGSVQPIEPDYVPIENSLETSHLLDQVRRDLYGSLLYWLTCVDRLMRCVALFGSCEQRIRILKVKTYSGRSRPCLLFHHRCLGNLHRHWTHLVSQTRTPIQILNHHHHLLFAHSLQKPNFFTGTLLNSRPRRASWICLRCMPNALKPRRQVVKCGCRRRRLQPIRFFNARWRRRG